jgi:hypothetical protein
MGKKTLGSPIERHLVKGKRFLGSTRFRKCKNTYEEKGNDGIDEDDDELVSLILMHDQDR